MTCNPETIKQFLAGTLDAESESQLELHLDSCHDCCQRMHRSTADEADWRDVRGLSSIDLDESNDPPAEIPLAFLSPTDDPRMLGRFAGYEIAGVVGQGGMGLVLKAFDAALNRYAAIKVLAPHYATSAAARTRFGREAQAAAAVVHDNVIAIHGVGECGELPYLVMPYVRGESLQKRIDRVGSLPIAEVLRVAMQTAMGLAAAHDQGLVHRDIKPANILLSDGSTRVLITDFGLARAADDASLTRSGVIAGTPQYMSPEQARGEAIDARSDLFSLGSLMQTMSTGRPPFRAETPYGILRRITDDQPRPIRELNPDMPPWLQTIVSRLHEKRPSDRYGSATEVAELLKGCLTHVQTPGTPLPVGLIPRRKRTATWIAMTLATFFVAIAIGFWVNRSDQTATGPPTKPTQRNEATATEDWVGPATDELIRDAERLDRQTQSNW